MKSVLGKLRKPIFLYLLAAGIMICMTGCAGQGAVRLTSVDTAMGTVIIQQIYVEPSNAAYSSVDGEGDVTDAVLVQIMQLEQEVLSRRMPESEVSSINASAGKGIYVPLSEKLEGILEDCLEVSKASEGAFDITMGEVVRLWNIDFWAAGGAMDAKEAGRFDGQYELPDDEELSQTLALAGYEKLSLKNREIMLPEGMALDLGAVGKGIALDNVLLLLQEKQVAGAVISVGGSVLTYGEKPDGKPWNIGITDPFGTGENIGVLSLAGQWCVSTSGDYERYVEVDGIRYHHIINPDTGYPAGGGIRSVTILTKNGFLSDALSTACFVLGREKGMQLAKQYQAEALFVDMDGGISMTEGMEAYFHLSNGGK